MPVINRIAELQDEITAWRHSLHQNPELLFDVFETAAFVENKLKLFGCDEVVTGLGRTGVVGLIHGSKGDGPVIGLRADMDALPIVEETGLPYQSAIPGKMHACGHDGHSSMLLGAAQYLAETRNFAGSVALIFQPAEEHGGGGREMVQDGLMERFNISQVFGMHNMPGLEIGKFTMRSGPIMAATAEFTITVQGKGGHAASPNTTVDPIVTAAQLVTTLQTISSRSVDPADAIVVSVTKITGGDSYNIIPERVEVLGTVRTLRKDVEKLAQQRLEVICQGVGLANGASIEVLFRPNYPVTFNHEAEVLLAAAAARDVVGEANVKTDIAPFMGSEDFSYMLEARPGAFIFLGNGDTAGLHSPHYDFNDASIPFGVSYWVRLVEMVLARR